MTADLVLAVAQRTDETLTALAIARDRFGEWLATIPPPSTEAAGNRGSNPSGSTNNVGGGGLTQDQLTRLARCESGTNPFAVPPDPSPWRTGYFGLEAGSPVGQLSLGEQIAMVQDIYSRYGANAWGCGGVL